jgi:hypothetical protein
MTPTVDTSPLSDAEILHLLRTLAPGVPPGLDQPPLPPASLTTPPWVVGPRARSPLRALVLAAGSLGLLILWGLTHGARPTPPAAPATFATPAPAAVYWARAAATATSVSALPPVLPAWTPAPPSLTPTALLTAIPSTLPPPTLPPVLPTAVPPLPPPTATPVEVRVPPPAPPPVEQLAPPPPAPTATFPRPATRIPPTPVPVTPPTTGGSGAWGNDWSGSIFDRSATIGAPAPAPTISP